LIPLAEQDRTLWDGQHIAEGVALLSATLPKGSVGPYQLQAAINAVHDEAAGADDTDWPQILGPLQPPRGMSDNPMVALNRAIAAAMVYGPAKGLESARPPSMPTPALPVITASMAVRGASAGARRRPRGRVRHYRPPAGMTAGPPATTCPRAAARVYIAFLCILMLVIYVERQSH